MCTAISPAGALAAGLADGRLWMGFGGEKSASPKPPGKKRARKWNGLAEEGEIVEKVADGPVVAAAFIDADSAGHIHASGNHQGFPNREGE
ncbi:hypothetical protein AAF712_006453 [Marasmius tenuissimus]|uniref:Uncharacterized protein n=1 Tax=Marasmius tenuissimus TaxID=585030 RepID=A0ABR2ZXG7_9AGAR